VIHDVRIDQPRTVILASYLPVT